MNMLTSPFNFIIECLQVYEQHSSWFIDKESSGGCRVELSWDKSGRDKIDSNAREDECKTYIKHVSFLE